jgi:hypothetical protein
MAEDEDEAERLVEAAMEVLEAAPGRELNVVLLSKALFYLDLISLLDTGATVTGTTYVALEAGPVVAKYDKRLVGALQIRGLAEQYVSGRARPIRIKRRLEHYSYLTEEQRKLAAEIGRVTSQHTSTFLSLLSHKNPGWELAYEKGQRHGLPAQPIDMAIAIQQLAADDPSLNEEADEKSLSAMASVADTPSQPW